MVGSAGRVAEVGVDPGDVEAELAGVFGFEAADLELDDEEAGPWGQHHIYAADAPTSKAA